MMIFYNDSDEQSYRTLTIDSSMPSSDVCHMLTVKNHAKDDPDWVIVERLPKFNLGEW